MAGKKKIAGAVALVSVLMLSATATAFAAGSAPDSGRYGVLRAELGETLKFDEAQGKDMQTDAEGNQYFTTETGEKVYYAESISLPSNGGEAIALSEAGQTISLDDQDGSANYQESISLPSNGGEAFSLGPDGQDTSLELKTDADGNKYFETEDGVKVYSCESTGLR